jgi:cyclin A
MSNPFGFTTGIQIHQDLPHDSHANMLRKTKREELQGKPPATKRAALGTITNTTRVQPFRAAKQVTTENLPGFNNENAPARAAKSAFSIPQSSLQAQPFTIHLDEGPSLVPPTKTAETTCFQSSSSEKLQLHSGVTALRPVLATVNEAIVVEDSPMHGSPMVLDESVNLTREDIPESAEERLQRVLTVPDYQAEIYSYLRQHELRHRPKPGYMKKQPDITPNMRSILIDWLVEVAEEYKLSRESLFLSVNYIDRFLSQMSVLRGKLQLVGAASMFLAAKFEEIYPPDVAEFVYITDDTYTKKQVLRMEHLILKVLSFDVAVPTANCFCERFLRELEASDQLSSLAMYLCELTMVDADPFLKYVPSQIASSAVWLANFTLGNEPWPTELANVSLYSPCEFQDCLKDLHAAFTKAPQHAQQAVREKYKQAKFHEVSLLTPPALSRPGFH